MADLVGDVTVARGAESIYVGSTLEKVAITGIRILRMRCKNLALREVLKLVVQKGDLGNSISLLSTLRLAQGVKVQGLNLGALGLQKFLWLQENVRTPKYFLPPSPLRKNMLYRYA